MIALILVALFGYLCGAIPFGLIFTRMAGTKDLRSIGSGNIGATNVLRTGRKDLAAATLLADALKGTIAVWIAARWGEPNQAAAYAIAASFGAFFGHVFPVWLGFKGGKGVATFLGCLLALFWPSGFAFIAVWLVMAFVLRYSSAAALAASAATPLVALFLGRADIALACFVLTALLWFTHRANIGRLVRGDESKIAL